MINWECDIYLSPPSTHRSIVSHWVSIRIVVLGQFHPPRWYPQFSWLLPLPPESRPDLSKISSMLYFSCKKTGPSTTYVLPLDRCVPRNLTPCSTSGPWPVFVDFLIPMSSLILQRILPPSNSKLCIQNTMFRD